MGFKQSKQQIELNQTIEKRFENKMSFPPFMTRETQYLLIKQKLDSYNISTSFPLQMMPLLQSLITRLQQQVAKNNSHSVSQYKSSLNQPQGITLSFNKVQPALRHQVQRTLSTNNQLHLQLITQKEEIQSLKHCIDKLSMERVDSSKKDEFSHVLNFYKDKERELVEQLQLVKFKYNDLVDFFMGEDQLEKQYIKKLLNHKNYDLTGQKEEKDNDLSQQKQNGSSQDLNSRITFKAGSSRLKQSRKRINNTIDSQSTKEHVKNKLSPNEQEQYQHKINLLKTKLINRETQIQRLHAVISHDGPNLNKVMTQFTHELQQKKYQEMQDRIGLLEEENQRIKKVLEKSKNTGGRYQALLEEVEKCHSVIENLKKQNSQLKRNTKQQIFDIEKEKKEISRSIKVTNSKHNQLKVAKYSNDLTLEELKKKVEFYEKQLGHKLQSRNDQIEEPKKESKKVSKKSVKVKSKESEKKEGKKAIKLKEDKQNENQDNRERYENEIKLSNNNKSQVKQKPARDKAKKGVKKLPISQIIQESEDDQEIREEHQQEKEAQQVEQRNEGHEQQNIQEKNKKPEEQKEDDEQQQENEQSEQSERNQTMIQQYEQTINELSSRCLQLKEELESKNQTIKGLEEIANRLMNNQKQQNPISQSTSASNISHLQQQLNTLSSLLNESQFQKEQLRRQVIQLQTLYKQSLKQQQAQISSQQVASHKQLQHLHKLLEQKDKKIEDMREDNMAIQDKLFKALDRIRRLNDQLDSIAMEKQSLTHELQTATKQKNSLAHELNLNQSRLQQAALLLKQQRERHTNTIQLSEIQKDQIILLRKNLLIAEERNNQLQQLIQALKEQNQRLVHQIK